jgi:hypothetical protein
MKRATVITMAALMLGATALHAEEAHGGGESAPVPETAKATSGGGGEQPQPGTVVTPDQLPGIRVQREIEEELANRAIPDKDTWRRNQRLSMHMDRHMGSHPERYHHLTDPEHTRYYKQTKAARANYEGELARSRELAEKEIALEEQSGRVPGFIEDGAPVHQKHVHIHDANSGKHTHAWGQLWANEWERTHKGCIWWIRGDIEKVGSREVPAGEDHAVPAPRPVRWNEANHACPLPYDTWFRPPPETTVVVPFPLPREGDWRAHLSPGMNKIVDKTDWLRVVREGRPDCPKDEPISKPEGDRS